MKVKDLFETSEWDNQLPPEGDAEYQMMLYKRDAIIDSQGFIVKRINDLLKKKDITMDDDDPAYNTKVPFLFWGMDSFRKPGDDAFQNSFYIIRKGQRQVEALVHHLRVKWQRFIDQERFMDDQIAKRLNRY